MVPVDCAVAVALLLDRDAVFAAGGYDESFFILFEDLDLSFRLRALGHRILSVEDAIVLHKGGTPGISFREGPSARRTTRSSMPAGISSGETANASRPDTSS